MPATATRRSGSVAAVAARGTTSAPTSAPSAANRSSAFVAPPDDSGVLVAAAPGTPPPTTTDDSGVLVMPAPATPPPLPDDSGVRVLPTPPVARTSPPSSPPPPPPPASTKQSGSVAAVTKQSGSVATVTRQSGSVAAVARTETSQPVPRGEFDDGGTSVEPDKLRIAHAQATIKRDAASALLEIPEAPLTQVKETPIEVLLTESAEHGRGDPTSIDPKTSRFERGDPTQQRGDRTQTPAPARPKVGRLRTIAALRRQRGLFGDARYVATVLFGVRRSRRELAALEASQESRRAERIRSLVTLGRTAVITDNFDHPALSAARERLGSVEEERAKHAGQVVAADQELQRVTRDRDAKAKQYATDLAAVDAELAEIAKRLEPLHKEHAAATRRAADLRETLRRIEQQIQEATAGLVAVKPKKDPVTMQAEIATLKADLAGTKRDEPTIAAELDALSPRIAALEAKRAEQTKRRAEMLTAETDDQSRAEELLAAIGAKRKVMDRAAKDAETLRDKILFELAERLYVDRPPELGPQLAPIDAIDVELGSADRRLMELREILSSIDRWKLARGVAVLVGALLVVGGLTAWILYLAL